jgi:hypothetical protein
MDPDPGGKLLTDPELSLKAAASLTLRSWVRSRIIGSGPGRQITYGSGTIPELKAGASHTSGSLAGLRIITDPDPGGELLTVP